MSAAVIPFVPLEQIERAVTVLEIALGRGLELQRALNFAVESIGGDARAPAGHVRRLVLNTWRRRLPAAGASA